MTHQPMMRRVCFVCRQPYGYTPCRAENDGQDTHGVCEKCHPAWRAKMLGREDCRTSVMGAEGNQERCSGSVPGRGDAPLSVVPPPFPFNLLHEDAEEE